MEFRGKLRMLQKAVHFVVCVVVCKIVKWVVLDHTVAKTCNNSHRLSLVTA